MKLSDEKRREWVDESRLPSWAKIEPVATDQAAPTAPPARIKQQISQPASVDMTKPEIRHPIARHQTKEKTPEPVFKEKKKEDASLWPVVFAYIAFYGSFLLLGLGNSKYPAEFGLALNVVICGGALYLLVRHTEGFLKTIFALLVIWLIGELFGFSSGNYWDSDSLRGFR